MEGNKAMLPGEEGMKGLLGKMCERARGRCWWVVCLVVAAPLPPPSLPPGSTMLPQGEGLALCGSVCPLTTSMSDPQQGRGGWINLAKQKNE